MLILRRRYEFYFFCFALCKIGAVYIPSTNQLKEKDIIYRNNAAGVKMIVSFNWPEVIDCVEKARPDSTTLEHTVLVGGNHEGWINYDEEIKNASDTWVRPTGSDDTSNSDLMLIYFTSGTTSMPKMACHDFTYPLGHIVTSKYWQRVVENGLHLL